MLEWTAISYSFSLPVPGLFKHNILRAHNVVKYCRISFFKKAEEYSIVSAYHI